MEILFFLNVYALKIFSFSQEGLTECVLSPFEENVLKALRLPLKKYFLWFYSENAMEILESELVIRFAC